MWVMSKSGFFSAVAYDPKRWPDEAAEVGARYFGDHVLVRGRVLEDIETLAAVASSEVTTDLSADYAFRTIIPKAEWAAFLSDEATDIDYTNFKSTVNDMPRHNAYMKVWSALRALQPRLPAWSGHEFEGAYRKFRQ